MIQETKALFPTPVTRFSKVFTHKQLVDIKQYLTSLESTGHSAFTGNAVSSHHETSDILSCIQDNVSSCKNFIHTINCMLDQYTAACGLKPVRIMNSWYNIQTKGSQLKQHLHANSIVSLVFYVHTDEHSSKIQFDNPNKFVQYVNQTTHPTDYNFEYYYFKPIVGDVFVFPGWLTHGSGYEYNETDQRTVISVNAKHD